MSQQPSLAAEHPPAPEACPPPLAWEEVLRGVDEQGQAFTLEAAGLSVRGVTLGAGPALWFLGGLSGDRRLFSLLAWLLQDRFRCVLADFEWSEPHPRPATLVSRIADTVAEAMNPLQLEQTALFGSSFGSQVALELMRKHGSRIRGGVLHAAFAHRRASLAERAIARGAAWSAKELGEIPSWVDIQDANHRRWFPPIDPSRWNFLLENLGQTPARRWSVLARAATATDLSSSLHEIRTPIQLIRTEGDGPVTTAAMNQLMVLLPNVREETLHTSGHYAFLTHPHRVAKVIAAFLNGLR